MLSASGTFVRQSVACVSRSILISSCSIISSLEIGYSCTLKLSGPRMRHSDDTAAKLGVAELRRVIIRVAEQIVTKHVVEAALPRLVGIAPDVDAFDEFHLLLTCVLDIDIDV